MFANWRDKHVITIGPDHVVVLNQASQFLRWLPSSSNQQLRRSMETYLSKGWKAQNGYEKHLAYWKCDQLAKEYRRRKKEQIPQ